ncbi:hypothetical protein [Mucilaginibacter sp.]|uniref:hypothetical protein n=1 Tax=Mucilaginibacter sp. TaxID=1882438 RepID=UPI003267B01B
MPNTNTPGLLLTGIIAALIAGTLDALAAVFILAGGKLVVFQYISGAVMGKESAYSGGTPTILLGLFFHYIIAASFTLVFFLMYPRIAFLRNNAGLIAFLYGIFIFVLMNRIVVPLTLIHVNPFNWLNAVKNCAILITCVALPIVLARYWYENRQKAA